MNLVMPIGCNGKYRDCTCNPYVTLTYRVIELSDYTIDRRKITKMSFSRF